MSLMGSARQEREPRGEVNTILVFSDTHGRIPLMLRLVWQWQREHDRHVDLILVAGDLGVWPESERLDSSTRKYSQIDPAELGFQVFEPIGALVRGGPSTKAAAYLADAKKLVGRTLPEINAKIVFVGGNHEDYDYLADCGRAANAGEQPLVAVEASRRLYWLPSGQVWELPNLRVTGLSGIDPAGCGRDAGRYHPASVMTEDSVIESTLAVLEASAGREIDVLLTHDGLPDAAKPGKGTFKLLEAITSLNPRYHFFGHYHSEVTPLRYTDWLPQLAKWYPLASTLCSDPGHLRTSGVHINKLAFDRRTGRLRRHVMGLLEIDDPEQYRFEFVQEDWLSNIDEQPCGDSASDGRLGTDELGARHGQPKWDVRQWQTNQKAFITPKQAIASRSIKLDADLDGMGTASYWLLTGNSRTISSRRMFAAMLRTPLV